MEEFLRANWQSIAVAVAAVFVAAMLWKFLRPSEKVFVEGMTLNVRCNPCGWQGTVTKYNQVCRKCNSKDVRPF